MDLFREDDDSLEREFKLAPDVKARWIAALASGDFRKGEGQLVTHLSYDLPSRYCCLGVANEVFDLGCSPAGGQLVTVNYDDLGTALREFRFLPLWAQVSLIDINDKPLNSTGLASADFSEVIEWIEENL